MSLRVVLLSLVSLATALALAAAGASAQSATAASRGGDIAARACAGCHALEGGAAAQPGTAGPAFREIAARPGQSRERLQSLVLTPHRPMPGLALSLAEVDDVVAYILSLR